MSEKRSKYVFPARAKILQILLNIEIKGGALEALLDHGQGIILIDVPADDCRLVC